MSSRICPLWAGLFLLLSPGALAQEAPRKLVRITASKGIVHEVVKPKDGKPSVVEQTFAALANNPKLFTVQASQHASILTPDQLRATDVLVFYTTEKSSTTPQVIDAYVKAGGKLLGIHPATDTFHGDATWLNLIG